MGSYSQYSVLYLAIIYNSAQTEPFVHIRKKLQHVQLGLYNMMFFFVFFFLKMEKWLTEHPDILFKMAGTASIFALYYDKSLADITLFTIVNLFLQTSLNINCIVILSLSTLFLYSVLSG